MSDLIELAGRLHRISVDIISGDERLVAAIGEPWQPYGDEYGIAQAAGLSHSAASVAARAVQQLPVDDQRAALRLCGSRYRSLTGPARRALVRLAVYRNACLALVLDRRLQA